MLLPSGSIRGRWYVLPIRNDDVLMFGFLQKPDGYWASEREYYERRTDGEWHWSHTADARFQKYPCYEEPEWSLPEGV